MPIMHLHKLTHSSPGPKFKVGQRTNSFTVTDVIGWSDIHPTKKTSMSKKQWWYRVRCSCGSFEVIAQGQLAKRKDCNECATDRKIRSLRPYRSNPIPPELDFAKMKLK